MTGLKLTHQEHRNLNKLIDSGANCVWRAGLESGGSIYNKLLANTSYLKAIYFNILLPGMVKSHLLRSTTTVWENRGIRRVTLKYTLASRDLLQRGQDLRFLISNAGTVLQEEHANLCVTW